MKVVLIEFIDEYKAFTEFIASKGLKAEDFVIVAIEPKAGAYLASVGVSYRDTLPYFNNGSHKKILVETEKAMCHIRENFSFTDGNGIGKTYENEVTHYLRLYLNHFYKILEILEKIYREDKGCEIFASVGNRITPTGLITDSERYLGSLAESFAKLNNLAFTNFNKTDASSDEPDGGAGKRWPFLEKAAALVMLLALKNKKTIFMPRSGHVFGALVRRLPGKKAVFLAIDYTGDLFKMTAFNIISFLRYAVGAQSYRYYLLNPDFIGKKTSPGEWERLDKALDHVLEARYEHLYVYNGVSCLGLLKNKADNGLKKHMRRLLEESHGLAHLFRNSGTFVVLSYSSLGIMSMAGELAKKSGRASLFVSHGAHPVPVDDYHEIELLNLCRAFMLGEYTHVALCSPVQEEHLHYFKKKYGWVKNTELKTGPLVFSSVRAAGKTEARKKLGIGPGEVVITHATTTKARQGERYYFLETLDELFSSLGDLAGAVNAVENARFLIRIHPGFQLRDDEIRALLPKSGKFILHREGHFSDALAVTDVLVSYSSTTIDEALMSGVPVLLYDKWKRYNHFKTGVFASPGSADIFPVCYVDDAARLKDALVYMTGMAGSSKKEDMDVSRYSYKQDYSGNFFAFIDDALKTDAGGAL